MIRRIQSAGPYFFRFALSDAKGPDASTDPKTLPRPDSSFSDSVSI